MSAKPLPHRDPAFSVIIIAKIALLVSAAGAAALNLPTLPPLLRLARVSGDYGLIELGVISVATLIVLALGLLIWALVGVRRVTWASLLPAAGSFALGLTALVVSPFH